MIRRFTLLLVLFLAINSFAQSPQKFSYQTVVRNSEGQLLANQQIAIKTSILQGSESGIVVYAEQHTPNTNANGLASLQIGGGSVLNGSFTSINWAQGPYFISTETDPNGGNNYSIISTQQLLSVPYALYAEKAPDIQQLSVSSTGDSLLLLNGGYVIIPGISAANIGGNGQTGITDHTCGATNVHNPSKTYGTLTDQEGNTYKTIMIGNQIWMAENLKTSIYLNGDPIPNIVDSTWANLSIGAWCYYINNIQLECPYGKLYNWYSVADPRNICPAGWHVPTDAEWLTLTNFLGGAFELAASKMKSASSQYWNPATVPTNESGFSALPSGGCTSGYFVALGSFAWWWSATEYAANTAWYRDLSNQNIGVSRSASYKSDGFSVRCIKN